MLIKTLPLDTASPALEHGDIPDLGARSIGGDGKSEEDPELNGHYEGCSDCERLEGDGGNDDNDTDTDTDTVYTSDMDQVVDPPLETRPYFFKSSWSECIRDKEFRIIETAHNRAEALLGEYARMVIDHIPKLEASQVNVRCGLDGRLSISKQAWVRNWQVCHRLKPITELEPDKFWKVFWDIVRCLYLMWKIGIAHGDISLSNMMYYERDDKPVGVLNDFDLATIMKVGDRTPAKRDPECTGTIPFMAVDLLDFPHGEIGRRFRPDLDSCVWCKAWEMLKKVPEGWFEGDMVSIRRAKKEFMELPRLRDIKSEWSKYFRFLSQCLRRRDRYRWTAIDLVHDLEGDDWIEGRLREEERRTDEYFIRPDVEVARSLQGVELVEALEDLSWIDVIVDREVQR